MARMQSELTAAQREKIVALLPELKASPAVDRSPSRTGPSILRCRRKASPSVTGCSLLIVTARHERTFASLLLIGDI
jgi:hypothetical protein